MTRNLRALGLALLAICALGALVAQGASAAVEHDFHSDGPNTIITGENIGAHTFAVGKAGTVECTIAVFEATQGGATEVSAGTFKTDTITVTPHYSGCTFGGQPATVNFNHCAYVFDSDTTLGNPDEFPKAGGGTTKEEHASVEIECAKNKEVPPKEISKIEVDTSVCTITIGGQQVADSVRYVNKTASSIELIATAKNVVTGKEKTTPSQTGCLLFPTGAIGTYNGAATSECFEDEGDPIADETEKTTPNFDADEGDTTECTVSNL